MVFTVWSALEVTALLIETERLPSPDERQESISTLIE
jgi:hypothetical protein